MKKLIKQILIIATICAFLPGCASIVHGTRQKIAIATDPLGAEVSTGEITMTTPCSLNLKRKNDHILSIHKPGYETETVKLTSVLSGAVAGNILLGGPIGWGVDAISGAQWRLDPETVSIKLRHAAEDNNSHKTLSSKLEDLASLKEKELITEEEYNNLRQEALK